MIVVFSMIGTSLFKDIAPEYFANPIEGIYSTFRIFTGEGWNEIPDTVAQNVSHGWAHAIRLYFSCVLIVGCIIGMSLLNSIFVDAMVSDNNNDVEDKLNSIESKLAEIQKKYEEDVLEYLSAKIREDRKSKVAIGNTLIEENNTLASLNHRRQELYSDIDNAIEDITKKAMEYGVNALLGHDICR